jgi:hypothetical protein
VHSVAVDTGRPLHVRFPVQRFIIPKNNYESRTHRMTECKSPGEEGRLGKCTKIRKRYAILLKLLTWSMKKLGIVLISTKRAEHSGMRNFKLRYKTLGFHHKITFHMNGSVLSEVKINGDLYVYI